jgi:hypothetical protein
VLFERTLSEWLRIHTGHIGIKIVKEPCGSIQKVPSGYFGGHFSKEPTTYLLGNDWANCFRAHKELTMDPLGKFPLAPSDMKKVLNDDWWVTPSPANCSERLTHSAFLPTCEDGEDSNNGE